MSTAGCCWHFGFRVRSDWPGFCTLPETKAAPWPPSGDSIFLLGALSVLTLANRLVVREYTGRTQLFLETLPVSRAQVVAVKWLTGAVLLAIPMAAGFAVTLHVAFAQVTLTSRFIQLIAVRGGTFLLFAYSLAFFIA